MRNSRLHRRCLLLRGADAAAEPYVSKTANLRRRLQRLLAPPESQSKRLNLRERVAIIEYSLTGSDFESTLALYRTLRKEFPESYQKRLASASMRRWCDFNLENEYPRAYVTTRIGKIERTVALLWAVPVARGGREVPE